MEEYSLQIWENNPILRAKSDPIWKIDKYIKNLAIQLEKYMFERDWVGLAAPQIWVNLRIIATTQRKKTKLKSQIIMINPKIIERSKETIVDEEACISLPKLIDKVKRHQNIKVEYTDIKWNKQCKKYKNLNAIIIQHEIDHLDWILFIDRVIKTTGKED